MAKTYRLAALGYGILLAAFTGYVMLDTFVLATPEQTDATGMNLSLFSEETVHSASEVSETETLAETSAAPSETASAAEEILTQPATEQSAIPIGTARPSTETETDSAEPEPEAAVTASESSDAEPIKTLPTTEATEPEIEFISSDTVYQDENICITLNEYYENSTAIYTADIRLSSAQYLKTAFAADTYGSNITAPTSETAAEKNAVLAVNGDFYGSRESGYVIRNGILYRDYGNADTDILCIMADGSFFITNSDEYAAQELLDMGTWQAFSFGPALVRNGEITVGAQDEVGRAMASNPRTAIGILDDLHYVFVVSDGRTNESEGLSLYELAQFMQQLGAETAYNLDGGGSSTMYFNGAVINNPTTSGRSIKERSVSDIVYIGY